MAISTVNPATGETLKTFNALTEGEIETKLALSTQAFKKYRAIPITQRAEWMRTAATILEQNKAQYAQIMTLEMGKPIKSAIAEVEKCATVCRYYADSAAKFLADAPTATDASSSFIRYRPILKLLF